jgi:hypothetical protein
MKIPQPFQTTFDRVKAEASRLGAAFRSQATDTKALSEILRPNLGPTPKPLRRLLEPVVAVAALSALVSLATVGAVSFALLVAVAGVIYAILTYVFGLELDLAV